MNKVISMSRAIAMIQDGMTVMIGGFMCRGGPNRFLHMLSQAGVRNLTLIANDGGSFYTFPYGIHELIHNGQVKKLIASHIGLNPEVGQRMNEGSMEVELVPQGSLVEKIRAGGAGLGGVLTPTGIGTIVAEGKETIAVDGKAYLLEKPLRADVAIINGCKVDMAGNVWYNGSTRNFNVVMATAADLVICEADHVVELGEIDPNNVVTPGILVDYVVDGGEA